MASGSVWSLVFSCNPSSEDDLEGAKTNTIEKRSIGSIQMYLLPYKHYSDYKYRNLTNRQKIELEQKNGISNIFAPDVDSFLKIENMFNKAYGTSDTKIDSPVWKDDGKKYLHIFSNRRCNLSFEMDGTYFDTVVLEGHNVYEKEF